MSIIQAVSKSTSQARVDSSKQEKKHPCKFENCDKGFNQKTQLDDMKEYILVQSHM
jgi:hypothetical protein